MKDRVKMKTLYKSILKINDIYELKVAKFIYFYNQKRLPKILTCPLNQLVNSTAIQQDLS